MNYEYVEGKASGVFSQVHKATVFHDCQGCTIAHLFNAVGERLFIYRLPEPHCLEDALDQAMAEWDTRRAKETT